MYGSNLSSLDLKFDENLSNNSKPANSNKECDSDLECIKEWGPKFKKISEIYGLNSDEDENRDEK